MACPNNARDRHKSHDSVTYTGGANTHPRRVSNASRSDFSCNDFGGPRGHRNDLTRSMKQPSGISTDAPAANGAASFHKRASAHVSPRAVHARSRASHRYARLPCMVFTMNTEAQRRRRAEAQRRSGAVL